MIHPCPSCKQKQVRNPNKKEQEGSKIKDFRLYKICSWCRVIYKAYDE